jgi:hypothetical protein
VTGQCLDRVVYPACNNPMTIKDKITPVQSFTERTLKYGRNVMVAAAPILVFYHLDAVNIKDFKPFGFEIKSENEFWIWALLLGVLVYYGARFLGLAWPDYVFWRSKFGKTHATERDGIIRTDQDISSTKKELFEKEESLEAKLPEPDQRNIRSHIDELRKRVSGLEGNQKSARFNLKDMLWRRRYFWLFDGGPPLAMLVCGVYAAAVVIYRLW